METRPKLKIQLSSTDKFIEVIGWFSLVCLWIICILPYENLPEIIPTHFNASMEANDYGSKMSIFFLPVIGTLLFLGLSVLNEHPHIFNYPVKITADNALYQYTNATRMIRSFKLIIAFVFGFAVYMIYEAVKGKAGSVGFWGMPLVLGIIFIPLVYFIVKAVRGK